MAVDELKKLEQAIGAAVEKMHEAEGILSEPRTATAGSIALTDLAGYLQDAATELEDAFKRFKRKGTGR